jgi:HK97 family phage prohead protease
MTEAAVKREAPPTKGIRHIAPARDIEIREDGGEAGGVTFAGYAVLFDDPTTIYDWLGSFTERFARGAFKKTIAERGPQGNGQIKFLRSHDSWVAIGAKFLSLKEDDRGLRFEAETINTSTGRDLAEELRQGVMDTVSIGFDAVQEKYNADEEERTVLEARLFEISAVNWPAYPNAKIDSVRAFERLPAYMDNLLAELRAGKVISAANMNKLTEARELLDQVIDSATPEPEEDPLEDDRALTQELAMRELEVQL